MKFAVALLAAVACVVLAQVTLSQAKPEPKPFSLGKVINKVSNVLGSKGDCLAKNGVPQHLLKKAVGCSPMALAGPGSFATCAGLSSFNDAKNAVKCFTG